MRSSYALLLAASLVALACAFPGVIHDSSESGESNEKDDDRTILVPPRSELGDLFDGFGDGGNPFGESFNSRLQDVINQFRAQMASAFSGMGPGSFSLGSLSPWGPAKLPEGANTTSTTQVINNQKVTINETTYEDGDDNSKTIVRVRVVHVNPLEESSESSESDAAPATTASPDDIEAEQQQQGTASSTTAQPTRSVEAMEEFDNEIPKSQVETLSA